MSDINCAVCDEPWDSYHVSTEFPPWQRELFKAGAGCESCAGVAPEGKDGDAALESHLRSVVFGGSDDPDSFSLLHDPGAKRPVWKRPDDVVVFQCAGCDSRIMGDVDWDPVKSPDLYFSWSIPTISRKWYSHVMDFDDPTADSAVDDTFEIGGKRYCPGCAHTCGRCNTPVFRSNTSCTGAVLYGDTYDPGASFPDPDSMWAKGICNECQENIPTCSECGETIDDRSPSETNMLICSSCRSDDPEDTEDIPTCSECGESVEENALCEKNMEHDGLCDVCRPKVHYRDRKLSLVSDLVPLCPKCGCPAQIIVLTKARVRCVLEDDGTPGKVLSASRDTGTAVAYECSGSHIWLEEDADGE